MGSIGTAVTRMFTPPKPDVPAPAAPPVAPVVPTAVNNPVPTAIQRQTAAKQDNTGRDSTILSNQYSGGDSDVLG